MCIGNMTEENAYNIMWCISSSILKYEKNQIIKRKLQNKCIALICFTDIF